MRLSGALGMRTASSVQLPADALPVLMLLCIAQMS